MTASGATMKANELLKCSDPDFDMGIKEMSLKELLDTISLLQKEMSREQENFNSLRSELATLNKNSRQYKQIQREMSESQNKLTALMNRSMRCFQQQGNQHISKPGNPVQRRNSGRERAGSADSNVQRRHSAKLSGEEVVLITSSLENPTAKSNPDLLNEVSSKPVLLKPLNDLDNSKLFVKKQNIIHTSTVAVKPQQFKQPENNVEPNKNDKENTSVVNVQSSVRASNSQNGFKPAVPVNQVSVKSSVKQPVVVNKAVVNSTTKINVKNPQNDQISNITVNKKELGQVYSSNVVVKPSDSNVNGELQKPDTVTKTADQAINKQKSWTPPVVLQGSRPLITDSSVGANRDKLFDEIKNFKRKSDKVPNAVKPEDKSGKEIFISNKTDTSLNKTKESTESGTKRNVEKTESEEADSGTEDANVDTGQEQEKFVSKYSFPQKPKRDAAKLEEKKQSAAPAPPVPCSGVQRQISASKEEPLSSAVKGKLPC